MRSVCDILKNSKNIAVIGISDKHGRYSHTISVYLKEHGYNVAGVNPLLKNVDGIPVYPNLKDVPFEIDIVNVFRRSETIPEIIPDVLEIKPKVLWLQTGIYNDAAVQPIIDAGIETIQDTCIFVEHRHCAK